MEQQHESMPEHRSVPFAPDLHDARHLWLKAGLLLVWAVVSFGLTYFARALHWRLGPWPLHYWIASQGAVLVFIAIVWVYCAAMSYFERQDSLHHGGAQTSENDDEAL
ncbi:hypothetical protein GCM10022279_28700 [Comamonas faecalis]|uniref:Sodium symporter small subunit domain-containing protein n=1 Tax=Comamonas faecalis TaxID=1387849 RepID=A0ABP7RWH2_9BURK